MTTVTVAEAREALPDLLRRAAAGEQIVITDGGKWLAALAAPPAPPPTPEEEMARRARVKAAILEMVRQQVEAGNPPPADSKIWAVVAGEECR